MPYDGLRAVMKEPWQVMVGFTALAVRDEAKRSLNTWMTGGSTASSAARPGHRAQDLAGTGRPGRRLAGHRHPGHGGQRRHPGRHPDPRFGPPLGLRDLSYDFA